MSDGVMVSHPINGMVTEKLLALASGISVDALSHYRRDGKVKEGVHYIAASKSNNGRVMWDVEEFNKWLRESKSTRAKSGSGSCGKASGDTRQQGSSQALRV